MMIKTTRTVISALLITSMLLSMTACGSAKSETAMTQNKQSLNGMNADNAVSYEAACDAEYSPMIGNMNTDFWQTRTLTMIQSMPAKSVRGIP